MTLAKPWVSWNQTNNRQGDVPQRWSSWAILQCSSMHGDFLGGLHLTLCQSHPLCDQTSKIRTKKNVKDLIYNFYIDHVLT